MIPNTTPLTPECARARTLLDRRIESELSAPEAQLLDAHLSDCAACGALADQLERAFSALASLSPGDLGGLRSPLEELERERSASLLLLALVACATLSVLVLGGLWVVLRPQPAPSAPPPVLRLAALPLPEVGGGLGVEEDPDLVRFEAELPPVEATLAAGPALQAEPIPLAAAVPPRPLPPQPAPVQPAPVAVKPAVKVVVPVKPPTPLPQATQDRLARLQTSGGLRYRGVTLFFIRDPEDRRRIGSARTVAAPSGTEPRPRVPESLVVYSKGGHLLLGELIEAPFGPRIAPTTRKLIARGTLPVEPIRYEPLAARPKPLLKGPVLVPSAARLAQVTRAKEGSVAVFLQLLDDPRLDALERLRLELGEVEAEALDLERRLRGVIGNTRGLCGLGYSVGSQTRSLDVFGSVALLTESLPKLLRTALLEERLGKAYDRDAAVDPRSTAIEQGVTEGQKEQRELLTLLATSTQVDLIPMGTLRKIDARYESLDKDGRAGLVLCQGEDLIHALGISPSASGTTTKR